MYFTSVFIDTNHSVFFLIRKKNLNQNNSLGSGDYRKFPNEKKTKKNILSYSIFEKTQISIKIY